MSEKERICRNCGARVGPHDKACPNCGRLFVDRRSARLGAEAAPPTEQDTPVRKPTDKSGSQTPVNAIETSGGSPAAPEPTPKPSSYYAVAPMTYEECPYCGGPANGGVCQKCGRRLPREKKGCCSCAVFLGIIGWLMTLVFVL